MLNLRVNYQGDYQDCWPATYTDNNDFEKRWRELFLFGVSIAGVESHVKKLRRGVIATSSKQFPGMRVLHLEIP